MDDNVTTLPLKRRTDTGKLMLLPPPANKCSHYNASFEVDEDSGECTCLKCGGKVTPIFVLKILMHHESRWNKTREAYAAEMKRLGERSKTKCQHCGKITRVSNR